MTIKSYRAFATFFLLAFAPLVTSMGVNCEGSDGGKKCKEFVGYGNSKDSQFLLLKSLDQVDDTSTWSNGQNIACANGGAYNGINGAMCVWVWNTDNTTTGSTVKLIASRIPAHGCRMCGSAPIVEDGSNDVSKGEVTIGWAWNEEKCAGVCNEYGGTDYTVPNRINPDIGPIAEMNY